MQISEVKTLEAYWEEYYKGCYPEGTPDIQRKETRQAFICGFVRGLHLLIELRENDTVSSGEIAETLEKLFFEGIGSMQQRAKELFAQEDHSATPDKAA